MAKAEGTIAAEAAPTRTGGKRDKAGRSEFIRDQCPCEARLTRAYPCQNCRDSSDSQLTNPSFAGARSHTRPQSCLQRHPRDADFESCSCL